VTLQRTPFHRVTYRRKLFMGGEREPAMICALVAFGIAVNGQNIPAFITAALLWFCALPALRRLAKVDPQMMKVYIRNIRYAGYYPARSRPYIGNTSKILVVLPYLFPGALIAGVYVRYWVML
jgi:type IV secretory pathway TrbD component